MCIIRAPQINEKKKNELNPDKSDKTRWWLNDLNLFLVAVFWGVNMPVMKFALARIDEYLYNALRLTLSAFVLWICYRWQGFPIFDKSEKSSTLKHQFLYVALFAIMTGFAYQVLFLWGINQTSAGNTALIMSAIPMWTAILAFLMLKENLAKGAWIGLTIAVTGTIVVTLNKSAVNTAAVNTLTGNLLVSGAAFSWALASVMSRPIMKSTPPVALAYVSMVSTLPLHYLLAWNAWPGVWDVFYDPILMVAIFYSGVFSTGVALAMWNFGVQKLGPAHAAGYQNLVPLIALLASWLLISELPVPLQIIGGVLIISGLIQMRRHQNA